MSSDRLKSQFLGGIVVLVWLLTNSANAAPSLVWDSSTPSPAGYKIYYSSLPDVSLQYTNVGATTSVPLDFLASGRTYLLYVTAYSSEGLESDPSATVSFTLTPPPAAPSITSQPLSQSVALGGAFTLSVTATGSGTPSYQWQKNGANISGATSASYSISSAQTSDAAAYVVRVSNTAGTVTSSVATITVISPPTISAQPLSQSVNLGAAVTLSVTATGSGPLTYQWQKGGANIPGTTSASYSISSAQASDAGAYVVRVSNTAGTVTSSAATITVISPPTITAQPVSQSVNLGAAVTLSVTATGSGPLTYQWQKSGANIPGATSTSYSISSAQASDAGAYVVRVSNAAGTVTSSAATITVISPPTITAQPVSQSVNLGSPVTLSVTATGSGPLTYQWQKGGANIPGTTSASYSISSALASDAGSYVVRVSNTAGTVTSSAATITVISPPTITAQPVSQSINLGAAVTLSVTATGSGPLTYQWQKSGANIPSATSASYSISSALASDAASYVVRVSNTAGTVTSSAATITVISPPTITAQPVSQSMNLGSPVTLSVTATGSGTLSYQWQKNGTDISGATSTSYSISSALASDAGSYVVRVSNTAGTVTSSAATITVISPPTIAAQPVSQSVNLGSPVTLSVTATGSGTLSYQWQRNGADISGATSASYSISTAQASDGASYIVRISNSAGTVTSSVATITVISPPTIAAQPVSQSVNPGSPVTLSVSATGSGTLSYQWQKNGTDISGATMAIYSISSAQASDAASYIVRISNSAGTVTSSVATITILSGTPPVITRQPGSLTVDAGSIATFSVEATGTTPLSYQWIHDGSPISGATSAAFSIPAVVLSDAGNYSVEISSSGGATMSDVVILTVGGAPIIISEPQDTNAPVGSTVSLSVEVNGVAPMTFLWSKNGTPLSGKTNRVLSISSAKSNDNGTYAVQISNGAGQATSRAANVKIYSAPKITRSPKPRSVSAGSLLALSVEAESDVPLTYSWLKDGSYIPGATNSTFEVSAVSEQDSGSYSVEVSNPAGSVVSDIAGVTVGTEIEETRLDLAISETDVNILQLTLSGEPGTYELQQTTNLNAPWTSIVNTNISSPTEILVPKGTGDFGFFRVVRVQN